MQAHGTTHDGPRSTTERIAAVASLDDPVRRSLYDYVAGCAGPVGRDAAAGALGLARSTAAFHLDRLVEQGLLTATFERLTGRTGPGSGRPAKLYTRAPGEVGVTLPSRRYELMGELLASVVDEAEAAGRPVRDLLYPVAHAAGRRMGLGAASFEEALSAGGLEPRCEPGGDVVLGTCPFSSLAAAHTELVCALNHGLVQGVADGVAEGTADPPRRVDPDPSAGCCCVRARAAGSRAPSSATSP